MASTPPTSPPPQPPFRPPFGPADERAWKYQRRMMRDQAKAQRGHYRFQMRAMRRRSVLGPVLAVAVGVVFLLIQTGHLANDRVWEFYGRWWPLLLVLGGVVLLAEWAVDLLRPRDPGMPYMRRSVGGGTAFLIILLGVVGPVVDGLRHGWNNGFHDGSDGGIYRGPSFFGHGFAINPDDFAEFMGSKHESDQSLDQLLPAGGSVTVENPHGDVTVTGTSTDGRVHVAIHKQVYSNSDTEAETKARELAPRMDVSGKLLSVTIASQRGATADVTLTVPPTAMLTVNANHGDVRVETVRAPLTVTANHGEIALSEIAGAVVAHANHSGSSFSAHGVAGPVSLEGRAQDLTLSDIRGAVNLSGDFYGTTHLEHLASTVRFHTSRTDFVLARLDGEVEISSERISADQAMGPVVLTTRNRNISLERIAGELSVTNRNGTVDLTSAPPLGNVTVQNRNGTVSLTLPDHASFAVDAETSDGEMQNDFSLPSRENDSHKTLNGTVGKGGPLVRITTSQGDVWVRRATIAPLPVAPPAPPSPPATPEGMTRGKDGGSMAIERPDGGQVYKGRDGTEIVVGADGSKVYQGSDGTRLTEGADGSKEFQSSDGTKYSEGADGSKVYQGADGTHLAVHADESRTSRGADGSSLREERIRELLRRAEEAVHRTEQRRDELLRLQSSGR